MVLKVHDSQQTALIHSCDMLHATYRHLDQEKQVKVAQNNAIYCLCEALAFDESEKSLFTLKLNIL